MKLYFSLIAVFVFFLNPGIGKSQEKNRFAVGLEGGYRIYSGCFFIDYNISGNLTITSGFSQDRYQGLGISPGILYYFMQKRRIRTLVGLLYQREIGLKFSYDRGNDLLTTFKTKDANYLIPMTGIRYNGLGSDTGSGLSLSAILKLGYRINSSISPGVSYVSGPSYPEKLQQISDHMNNSFIASVGIILNFGRKHSL